MRAETDREVAEEERRWAAVEASLGALASREHAWDHDVEAWVRAQREQDPRRVG